LNRFGREPRAASQEAARGYANNVESQDAIRAAQALYFPQIIGNVVYFHFNDDLGTVLTTSGRHV
jgi:hypothetical protein